MANLDSVLANRLGSSLIGLLMFGSALYLVLTIHFSLSQLLGVALNFNPYPFYFVGLVIGFERLIFGITGDKRLYYLIMGEKSDLTIYFIQSIFIFGIIIGAYIGAYALFLSGILDRLAELGEGVSFVLFAISLLKMP
ncbi:MAG: hypothetical protein TQ35_0002445 [Candidatus Aramenus sulfurataquae]|uniref:Uncharacterized protein n=3 Tax=Candidatus Aramenus sulfurataquae TaxID=1326980 RepID=A0A0F2LMV6_9CREN|nr:hypothetical protein [Candidatus Aramenus sulfurataquae]